MRKILMFGTMLGVASAALAFGGMFNHGNKSTTYKGGVDAIGVHFGGEKKTDSQPEEETCPDGVTKDNNGYCGLCDNGNLYFPYHENPCAEETTFNKMHCGSDEDCEEGCCSANGWCITEHRWDFSCETSRTCLSNDDCESGEFCDFPNTGNYDSPRWPGVCSNIGGNREIEYNNKTFVQSTELDTSFLGAMNWCYALGKEMATSEDIGLSVDCSIWGSIPCENIDLAAFKGLENDSYASFWLNNGMRLYKDVYDEDLDMEVFKFVDAYYGYLGWAPDEEEDDMDTNGALCK